MRKEAGDWEYEVIGAKSVPIRTAPAADPVSGPRGARRSQKQTLLCQIMLLCSALFPSGDRLAEPAQRLQHKVLLRSYYPALRRSRYFVASLPGPFWECFPASSLPDLSPRPSLVSKGHSKDSLMLSFENDKPRSNLFHGIFSRRRCTRLLLRAR